MNTTILPNRIAIEASASVFQNDLASADSVRASSLSGLQQVITARANHAQQAQQRLAQKLGAGDPQVIQVQTEVSADLQFAGLLGAEIDRVNARVPTIGKDGWAVFGFVWNAQWVGQPNLTVAIYDVSGAPITRFGSARTDAKGYFALPAKGAPIMTQVVTTGETGRAFATSSPLVMHVMNSSGATLFIDQTPLTVTAGTVEYRPIILDTPSSSGSPPNSVSEVVPIRTASAEVPQAKKSASVKKSRRKGK